MAEQRFTVAELYQTDLERHLFATSPRRSANRRRSGELTIDFRAWWDVGWNLSKSALGALTLSTWIERPSV